MNNNQDTTQTVIVMLGCDSLILEEVGSDDNVCNQIRIKWIGYLEADAEREWQGDDDQEP